MSHDINLKELERRAWRSVFQDGLWDIYLGLLLLAMAIGALLSDAGIASETGSLLAHVGLVVLATLGLWAGKRFITLPRLGRVKFGSKGKARKMKAMLLLVFSALLGAALFVFIWLILRQGRTEGLPLQLIVPAIWSVNALVVFSLGAYFLDYERLYLIGVMYAVAVPADRLLRELVGLDLTFLAFGVPAAVILITGALILVRFLRDYPVPEEEVSPAEEVLNVRQ
ncbi:MAG: hypothetical protein JSV81_17045 [Anaerolineales bacterium]|nr:MAG: hypothetical protein JSV81_17045 [Anaerolineales bacterium]